ncbi:MAG: hypothetical protein K2M43_01215 [Mycoplasmoidaceae bacterium]|nr:hypothetical protein [Mycoplasmoidaceae bacterium]
MQAANFGFSLFIGIMGAYIAEAIGGRAAFGPGLIASAVASTPACYYFYPGLPSAVFTGKFQTVIDPVTGWAMETPINISGISLGIIAALMMGFAAGYLVK